MLRLGILALLLPVVVVTGNLPVFEEFQCAHYNDKDPYAFDSPCKDESPSTGVCNTTETCKGTSDHCFSSWQIIDNKIQIIKQGCWIKSEDCLNNSTCVAKNNTDNKGVYACCCSKPLCNLDITLIPGDDTSDVTQDIPEDKELNGVTAVLFVLLPLLALACAVVLGFYCYRVRKNAFRDMEIMSAITPQSVTTQLTTDQFQPSVLTVPELIDLKARGRFGSVWKASYNGKIVAVKTFEPNVKNSWQCEKNIFNTPLLHSNPHILKFYGTATQGTGLDEESWLITEFHEHGSLTDYLKVNKITLDVALKIMETMARGLSFLHEDIVSPPNMPELYKPSIAHRDFKSKNVLLDRNLNAVIADFGLAVKFEPNQCPGDSHGQVGTLRYMAPEVLEGAIAFQRDAFLRIDMYAFALVLWEIAMRTEVNPGCEVEKYHQPFEMELGTHPTIEVMTDNVVDNKLRPTIKPLWKDNESFCVVCETMEECWDHDAEARLSAGCVEERMRILRRNRVQVKEIISRGGVLSGSVERMNQRNIEMQRLDDENDQKALETEAQRVTNGSLSSGYHSHALPNTPTHQSLSMGSTDSRSIPQQHNEESADTIPEVVIATEENVTQPLLM